MDTGNRELNARDAGQPTGAILWSRLDLARERTEILADEITIAGRHIVPPAEDRAIALAIAQLSAEPELELLEPLEHGHPKAGQFLGTWVQGDPGVTMDVATSLEASANGGPAYVDRSAPLNV